MLGEECVRETSGAWERKYVGRYDPNKLYKCIKFSNDQLKNEHKI